MSEFEQILKALQEGKDPNIVNHWGVTVDKRIPTTGVYSIHDIAWEFMDDEHCLTCEEIMQDIESYESLDDDDKQSEFDMMECDSSHEKIIGDWKKDEQGLYIPDESGEFAAIVRETTIQVVWSKFTSSGALCSPCYPGQVDMGSTGEFLAYALPSELLNKE